MKLWQPLLGRTRRTDDTTLRQKHPSSRMLPYKRALTGFVNNKCRLVATLSHFSIGRKVSAHENVTAHCHFVAAILCLCISRLRGRIIVHACASNRSAHPPSEYGSVNVDNFLEDGYSKDRSQCRYLRRKHPLHRWCLHGTDQIKQRKVHGDQDECDEHSK